MNRIYLKEVFELQRMAGIKEMDTPADAERDVYISDLLDRIAKEVEELQELMSGTEGLASIDSVLTMVKHRMSL